MDVWCVAEGEKDQCRAEKIVVEAIVDVVRRGRLPWDGHGVRKEENAWVKK